MIAITLVLAFLVPAPLNLALGIGALVLFNGLNNFYKEPYQ